MENWCDWPNSKGIWIILGEVSWQFHTEDKINDQAQAQPSYFKLEAEGKEWNSTGLIPPHSHHPFNSNLPALEIPAFPVHNPVPPALTSKATLPVQGNIPVSSTSVSQSSTNSDPVVISSMPRQSTHSTKGIPPVRFTPPKKWAVCTWNSMEVSGKAVFV